MKPANAARRTDGRHRAGRGRRGTATDGTRQARGTATTRRADPGRALAHDFRTPAKDLYITLANGRRVTVSSYTRAWESAKADPTRTWHGGPADDGPTERSGAEIVRQFRAALDDRINRRGGLVVSRRRCYPLDMVQPVSRTPFGAQFVHHLVAREGRGGMDEGDANDAYLEYRDHDAYPEPFAEIVAANIDRGMLVRRRGGEGGHRLFATRRGRREYRRSRRIHAVRPG